MRRTAAAPSGAARAAVGDDYEIVLNDGSRPELEVMAPLAGDPRLVAINLSRNYGHQPLTAGSPSAARKSRLSTRT